MSARRWCCGLMQRRSAWVLGLGVLGVLGFVGSFVLAAAKRIDGLGYLTLSAFALASYAASWLIGHLGDPFAPTLTVPTTPRQPTRHAAPQTCEAQALVWHGERTPRRGMPTTVGHA